MVEQKVKKFTTRKSDTEVTEYPSISQAMLETEKECVKAMEKEVTRLRQRFKRTS